MVKLAQQKRRRDCHRGRRRLGLIPPGAVPTLTAFDNQLLRIIGVCWQFYCDGEEGGVLLTLKVIRRLSHAWPYRVESSRLFAP